MTDSIYPKRWPVKDPSVLQLYSLPTPNGQKAGIVLEELELPYEAHKVDIMADEQFDEDYIAINPNSKIPTLIDPDGPDGKPLAIMESGAILMHLANKTGRLLPENPRARSEAIQWLFFQMASVGPMFGQFGHFYKFAKGKTDEYGAERYSKESKRLLKVLDDQLADRDYLAGEYSIADIAHVGWMKSFEFYGAVEHIGFHDHKNVVAWVDRIWERPAVQRGIKVAG